MPCCDANKTINDSFLPKIEKQKCLIVIYKYI